MLEIFQSQFMQNALLGGIIIGIILAVFGVFVVMRNQSLLADGIAHASLMGIAIGLVFSSYPTIWAILSAISAAVLITYLKNKTTSSFDAIIGAIYSLFFAIGILILSLSTTYQPEITSFLFGSILLITSEKIITALIVSLIAIGFIYRNYTSLAYMTFDEDAARVRGIKVDHYSYILNILIAVIVVISVDLLGVVMITSLLVLGPLFSKLFARKFSQIFPISIAFNLLSVIVGLIVSYQFNLPSGATIVIFGSSLYLLSFLVKSNA